MFRILYSVILPFLLPFISYRVYKLKYPNQQKKYPVQILTAVGLGLVFLFLFVFSVPEKAPANSIYTPPKFENGKIVAATLKQTGNND